MNRLNEIAMEADKILVRLAISQLTLLFTLSCGQFREKSDCPTNDSIIELMSIDSDNIEVKNEVIVKDTPVKTKTQKFTITSYYDYESETYIYYKNYIGKAYNDSIFKENFPNNIKALDLLIKKINK